MSSAAAPARPKRRTASPKKLEQTAKTVGARLRAVRKAQKVRLLELAAATGVDAGTISRIETGKMTGTLESHIALAAALGLKLTELYAGIEEARLKDAAIVQPPSARAEVYVHQAGKTSMAMLTTDILKKKLMPVLITIEPGGATNKEEAKLGTEKFLYVLDGALEARVGEATHHLSRGSSLYLDASVPHLLRNPGARRALCLAVTTPPAL